MGIQNATPATTQFSYDLSKRLRWLCLQRGNAGYYFSWQSAFKRNGLPFKLPLVNGRIPKQLKTAKTQALAVYEKKTYWPIIPILISFLGKVFRNVKVFYTWMITLLEQISKLYDNK